MKTMSAFRSIFLLASIFLAAMFNSCSDSSSGVATNAVRNPIAPGRDFGVLLSVVDASGRLVSGLDVSAWGIVSYPGVHQKDQGSPSSVRSRSMIMFSLPEDSYVRLEARDLTDSVVDVLVSGVECVAGIWGVQWSPGHWQLLNESTAVMDRAIPNGVYKIQLTASRIGETGSVYHEQQFAVLMDYGNPYLYTVPGFLIGRVENGEASISDPAVFCGAYSFFPDIPYTTSDPTPMGKVTITSRTVIVLIDRVAKKYQKYEVEITPHLNTFSLVWSPTETLPSNATVQPRKSTGEVHAIRGYDFPTEYRLYPNYPNPFN
jgi:hypothetical protein